jgi:hypothetical protein
MKPILLICAVTMTLTVVAVLIAGALRPAAFAWIAAAGGISGLVACAAGGLLEMSRHGSAQRAMAGFMVGAALRALVVLGVMIVTLQFNRDATIPATLIAVAIGIGASFVEAVLAWLQLNRTEQQHQVAKMLGEGESAGE